jgi:LEA14-like dessication related protein
MFRRLMAVLVAAAALAGCASIAPRMEPLSVSLADIQPGQISLLEQEYLIKVRVQNPNDVEVPVRGLSYQIDVNGKPFAKGVSRQDARVPAFGDTVLEGKAIGTLGGILSQLWQFEKGAPGKITYRLSGKLSAREGQSLPFDYQGNIELPGFGDTDARGPKSQN